MSSDKVANIREPFTTLQFDIETENGMKSSTVEMSKSQMETFVNSLEAASKVSFTIISNCIY